jgi:hypothetical protein
LDWKVVVHAENPSGEALGTLGDLTGLNRGELLRALRRGNLMAGNGFDRTRASSLARSLREDFGLEATALPDPGTDRTGSAPTLFRVVLTGYRPGHRARLRESLQRLSGLPPEQVVLWLSKIPFVLRDGTDHETARKIRRVMTEAGGMIDMRPVMDRPEVSPRGPGAPGDGAGKAEAEAGEGVEGTTGPPPAPASPPLPSRGPDRPSPPPPRICFLPPRPMEALKAPPVIEEEGQAPPEEEPPAFRFTKPRSGFVAPPVVEEMEPEQPPPPIGFDRAPQPDLFAPPEPDTRFRLLLHRPSSCSNASVEAALRSLLSMTGDEVARVMDDYPSWVASFGSRSRAEKVARALELKGATVSLLREGERPPVLTSSAGGESFRKWIGADG